jgi:hypothetical protein
MNGISFSTSCAYSDPTPQLRVMRTSPRSVVTRDGSAAFRGSLTGRLTGEVVKVFLTN